VVQLVHAEQERLGLLWSFSQRSRPTFIGNGRRMLGLTIPDSFLARADELIE